MSRVAVVIPNWNGRRWLGPCLSALRRQRLRDFRVVVVDNGSTDGSAAFLAEAFPEVETLALPENIGFAAGMNAGFRAAAGAEYLAALNNDTEASPDWLGALVAALDAAPQAGSAASAMLSLRDPGVIDSFGDGVGWTGLSYKLGSGRPARLAPRAPFESPGACAGACLYRARMLDEVGLFDEDYFAYMEDVDLALRARLAGWRCVSVPQAVVLHAGAASSGGAASDFSVRLTTRNLLVTLMKNAPAPLLAPMMALSLGAQAGVVALSLATGRPAWLRDRRGAWVAGVLAALRAAPGALAARRRTRGLRRMGVRGFIAMMGQGAALRRSVAASPS